MKIGDLVFIKKPKSVLEEPTWTNGMDIFDNTYQKVSHIRNVDYGTIFTIENSRFLFNTKWVHDKFEEHKRRLLSV